jgi:hypothetical protein
MNNSTAKLPIFQFPDGSKFLPSYQIPITETPWDGWEEEDLRAWVTQSWASALDARRPEIARLKLNSTYYDGFHYSSAWLNRIMPIENRIYEMVEALVANTIAVKPRPEIQPLRTMDASRITDLSEFATWYMDQSEWDHAEELSARDKKIYGYSIRIITFDYATGMAYPKPYSVFDYYPDPSGTRDDERSFWFLAGPKNTNRLRAQYPEQAENILPDNFASPAYAAVDRNWYGFLETNAEYDHPAMADGALAVHREGDTPEGTTTLVISPADRRDHGTTTFTLQMVVRDDAMVDATYWGTKQLPDGTQVPGVKYTVKGFSRRCASGFWLITMTSNGTFCHKPKHLDECYLGLPWVVDAEEERTDAAWSRTPIDHGIPIQRSLNVTNEQLDRGLELGANPPLKTTDPKLDQQLQNGPVAGGDTLLLQQGRDAEWLSFTGPDTKQFERVVERRGAMRDIVGVQGAMEGSRPPGIEAAAALRHLDNAAMRRVKAKENPASRARGLLLRKCIYATGKKLQPEVVFVATNGESKAISSDALTDLFRVRFAEGTGTVEGRMDRQDQAFALYDREAIDEQALLEEVQWPNSQEIANRMVMRKMEEKIMMAASAAANAPPGGGGGGKKSQARAKR